MNIDQLRSRIAGRVIEPGDRDYHDARKLFYGGMDRKPANIVRVAGAADVAHAIELARDSGLELAVRQSHIKDTAGVRGAEFGRLKRTADAREAEPTRRYDPLHNTAGASAPKVGEESHE